ncbi:GNAT family N-acetyltransferase [Streptomyces sp. NPDC000151]|uniref:GNAT family N-acetyltransferase n=1 Tax=Streptomyces sp. NPDC000151 TaxID=3154244 RepID=UPI003333B4CC
MEETETERTVLRRAGATDAAGVAEVWLRSYAAALPGVRRAHADDAVRAWFREVVVPERETWVADAGGEIAGMMVLHGPDELDQLYLAPERRGQGLGDRLVALAKERRPAGLALWTFQANRPAQRFYLRHGFRERLRTDGRDNEEREPDIRYVWTPPAHA